jgi:hypothetical protein
MNIELWPIDREIPYARNPRKVSTKAIDKVASSLHEFGWRQPIVVDRDGVIIVGHTRWRAAGKLGLNTVPVHVASELTPAQVKAYRIMDNRSHEDSNWDVELLVPELEDMKDLGIPCSLSESSRQFLQHCLSIAPSGSAGAVNPRSAHAQSAATAPSRNARSPAVHANGTATRESDEARPPGELSSASTPARRRARRWEAAQVTSSITSCRSSAAGPMSPRTCSGRVERRPKRRIESSS